MQFPTTVFLLLFILAFFPPVFNTIISLPLTLLQLPLTWLPSSSQQQQQQPPDVVPAICSPYLSQSTPHTFTAASMSWTQKTINLSAKSRGSYLVTEDITSQLPELKNYKIGLLNLFLQHTSAALSLNENYDEDVRKDMR